jgi:hypothetical protein
MKDKSALAKAKAIGQTAVPFQVQSAAGAPKGEELKRAVFGTLGLPIYGKKKE